ncbi:MAG: rod shape-determining protein [Syntrophothermus sp.]|uniref:cell division FtsA domain-containing protein n=1 Tax=Syntrophothermus sp. TaxID=2736299 RepID=UPI00257FD9E1|nr:cell division FtsA domain-containing protein [Syntrophothermus sp.]NSW82051.1 rod shape-determining protein [Syntrophothermus sp.]
MSESQRVFALDVGTRTVTGLVLEKNGSDIRILGARTIEHETRAMYDGQIHDVEAVAAVINRIKKELEDELKMQLNQAAVAAAGRALRTATGEVERQRDYFQEFTREEVHALELEAVQEAQIKIASAEGEEGEEGYFCVGYSVINYYLEGQVIGSLVGQVGSEVRVKVIATFLPRVVVDSLLSALRKAGLEMYSLTLEPIAAMSVAIPPRMRLLNLALVDVGAGTSDIAVVKKGTITAYGMVPIGGDEVTERIAEEYLLDFNTAENVKCRLGENEKIKFEDVLGNSIEVQTSEAIEVIRIVVRELAVRVAREILVLNQKAPDAVICVGGGSLTPRFLQELADCLELPANRVGIRTREAVKEIQGEFPSLQGPQGVTPLGIGFKALEGKPLPFMRVVVNQRQVPVWGLKETTVATALLSAGISLQQLYGKPGLGLTVDVNGVVKVIKGGLGTSPVIKVDGKQATLDTVVHDGAVIDYVKGQDGSDAQCTVRDIVKDAGGEVYVNGQKVNILPTISMNGQAAALDDPVPDRAKIQYSLQNSVREILQKSGVGEEYLEEKIVTLRLNDKPVSVRWLACEVQVNGRPVGMDEYVLFGSKVEYKLKALAPRVRDVLPERPVKSMKLTVNGKSVELPYSRWSVRMNGRVVSLDDYLIDSADIEVTESDGGAILSDVLGHIDLGRVGKGQLVMRVNGEKAGFTTPIFDGSQIEIFWDGEILKAH